MKVIDRVYENERFRICLMPLFDKMDIIVTGPRKFFADITVDNEPETVAEAIEDMLRECLERWREWDSMCQHLDTHGPLPSGYSLQDHLRT